MPKAKAGQEAPEQTALGPPIVFTLAADKTWADSTTANSGPYSWSKDGAAASTTQWVLPAAEYDVVCALTLDAGPGGVAAPVGGVPYSYTTTWGTPFAPGVTWVDDGDGTYSGTATSTARVTHSVGGTPWDVRFSASSSIGVFPITLKAGSTVTLTPVLAAAPPVHTWAPTPNSATVSWSPTARRDVEIDGVVTNSVNSGYRRGNLSPSTTYSTRTRVDSPESEWTAVVPFTTLALEAAPAAPTFTSITPTSFVVHWTPTGPRAVKVNGVQADDYAQSGYTVSGKTAETSYAVTTRKVDEYAAPLSEWSAVGNVTTPAVGPPVPTGVAVSEIGTTGFTVSCDVSPGATSYEVRTTEVQGAP